MIWFILGLIVIAVLVYLFFMGRGSWCICVFKGRTGKLEIDESCRGCLNIWVIPEDASDPAFDAPEAGKSYSADGFVLGGTVYKIDGSTCVEIKCEGPECRPVIWTCVNNFARIFLSKRAAYVVPAGTFGNEPPGGATPRPVR